MELNVFAVDPIEALDLCGGAARWTRLRDLGVPERAIRGAVRSAAVRSPGRGAFALPDAPAGLAAAVVLAGAASHVTAAHLHGWSTWNRYDRLTVTVPHATTKSLPGVTVYRAELKCSELDRYRACTGPLRTALDCGRSLRFVDAVCVLDAALRCAAVSECELVEAAHRARGPGSPELRRAVANVDARAASNLESVLRLLLRCTGARIRSQVWIAGVGTVDFVVDDWLVVEADGFAYHADRDSYRKDRGRGNGITVRGMGLLRFAYEDVRGRPGWVIAQVERVRRLRPSTSLQGSKS